MLSIKPIHTELSGAMLVRVYKNRSQLGAAAGREAAAAIRALLASKAQVRIVFAAAPSQNEFLAELAAAPDLDWSRITAFHMDEYIGLLKQALRRASAASSGRRCLARYGRERSII